MKKNKPQIKKTPSLLAWVLLFFLSLTWGSSYILIKKGLIAFSPIQVSSIRIIIAGIAFLPTFFLRYKQIDWKNWKPLLIVAVFGSLIPAFLFALAQTQINSSVTGVLSSLAPLFVLLMGILFFKIPSEKSKTIGVALGLAGAVFLIFYGKEAGLEGNVWYALLIVAATICYAISVNTVQVSLQKTHTMIISSVSFVFILIPSLIMLFSTDFITVMKTHDFAWNSFGFIGILSILGTVLASILFYKLVQLTNALFSSTVSYLVPIVALFWGAFDGEPITVYHFIGMVLILLGVYVASK